MNTKPRQYSNLIPLIFSAVILCGFTYHSPHQSVESTSSLSLLTQFLESQRNFGDDGSFEDLEGDNEFRYLQVGLNYSHSLPNKITLFGVFETAWAESVGLTKDRSRFAPSSAQAGGRYSLYFHRLIVEPELHVAASLSQNTTVSDDVYLNDSGWSLRPGAHFGLDFEYFTPYLYIGYDRRGAGLSDLFRYHAAIKFNIHEFSVTGFARGFDTISDDAETGAAFNRLARLNEVNAGSYIFDSVNPSSTHLGLQLAVSPLKQLTLAAALEFPFQGVRYAEFSRLTTFLKYNFGEPQAKPDYHRVFEDPENPATDDFQLEKPEAEQLFDEALKKKTPKGLNP